MDRVTPPEKQRDSLNMKHRSGRIYDSSLFREEWGLWYRTLRSKSSKREGGGLRFCSPWASLLRASCRDRIATMTGNRQHHSNQQLWRRESSKHGPLAHSMSVPSLLTDGLLSQCVWLASDWRNLLEHLVYYKVGDNAEGVNARPCNSKAW